MIQTTVTDRHGFQETFASENKFEAVIIGMRAFFKNAKRIGNDDLEYWLSKSSLIFQTLWDKNYGDFGNNGTITLKL